ncbi:hypothetical protein SAY87_023565 [Trapa incisa]|uniref:Uncharacterized protein n=1 Tax=Trapa incisa TaxID=236973 RepID=A0AAN7L1F7_9MYRT|nr:hypothetical protein SAY87_023565 [Trapa incisa]
MNPKAPEVIKPAMENAISLLSWIQDGAKDDKQRGCDHQANQRSGEDERKSLHITVHTQQGREDGGVGKWTRERWRGTNYHDLEDMQSDA